MALEEAKAAAEHAHIRLHVLAADQISEGFENARKAAAAGMLILEDPLIYIIRGQIAALAAGSRLPTIFVYKDSVEAG